MEEKLLKLKTLLDEVVASGRSVDDLGNGDEIYRKIKGTSIKKDGKELSVDEKFEFLGHKRSALKTLSGLDRVKFALSQFAEKHNGSIEELTSKDPEYKIASRVDIFDKNGRRLSFNEVCAMAGFRKKEVKKAKDVTVRLIAEATQFLDEHGHFHFKRKTMPFFPALQSHTKKIKRKTGRDITTDQAMKELGFTTYSDTYFYYLGLFDLEKFRDEDGFVDSFRSDKQMNNKIDTYAVKLDMPVSVVVELVGNENLRRAILHIGQLDFVVSRLEKYLNMFGSYEGISQNDPQLYDILQRLKNVVQTKSGKFPTTAELIEEIGGPAADNNFLTYTIETPFDFDSYISSRINAGEFKEHKIMRSDIPDDIYIKLTRYVRRNGLTLQEYFNKFGLEYPDFKEYSGLKYVNVKEYPYINEMRIERDKLVDEFKSNHPDFSEEQIFEYYIEACKIVYNKFKPKIEEFSDFQLLEPATYI
ncbi:MAG: hypothetical protein IJ538_03265 [Clostridia bacterium]|nr:hypothetical protein [Clostridia bacterium]